MYCVNSFPYLGLLERFQILHSTFECLVYGVNVCTTPRFEGDFIGQRSVQKTIGICVNIQWDSFAGGRVRRFKDLERPEELGYDSPLIPFCQVDTWAHPSSSAISVVVLIASPRQNGPCNWVTSSLTSLRIVCTSCVVIGQFVVIDVTIWVESI